MKRVQYNKNQKCFPKFGRFSALSAKHTAYILREPAAQRFDGKAAGNFLFCTFWCWFQSAKAECMQLPSFAPVTDRSIRCSALPQEIVSARAGGIKRRKRLNLESKMSQKFSAAAEPAILDFTKS